MAIGEIMDECIIDATKCHGHFVFKNGSDTVKIRCRIQGNRCIDECTVTINNITKNPSDIQSVLWNWTCGMLISWVFIID